MQKNKQFPMIDEQSITYKAEVLAKLSTKESFHGKAVLEMDEYDGKILKSNGVPVAAVYKDFPFAVENSYDNGKNKIKILDKPLQLGQHSATTTQHIIEFLLQNSNIAGYNINLNVEEWNKKLAEPCKPGIAPSIVNGSEISMLVKLHEHKPDLNCSFDLKPHYEQPANPDAYLIPVDIFCSNEGAAETIYNKVTEKLHASNNPYEQALAQRYEHDKESVKKTLENDWRVPNLVKQMNTIHTKLLDEMGKEEKMQIQQKLREPERTSYQRKTLNNINQKVATQQKSLNCHFSRPQEVDL